MAVYSLLKVVFSATDSSGRISTADAGGQVTFSVGKRCPRRHWPRQISTASDAAVLRPLRRPITRPPSGRL